MKTTIEQIMTASAVVIFCVALAPDAKADCGFAQIQQLLASPGFEATQSQARAAAALAPQLATPKQRTLGPSIIGLWSTTMTVGPQVTDQGIDAWHSDGTEVLNDTNSPHFCLGVWVQTGPSNYRLYHPFWRFDPSDKLVGSGILREQIAIDPAGDSYSGSFTVDFLDLSGNNVFHTTGQVKATRIMVD